MLMILLVECWWLWYKMKSTRVICNKRMCMNGCYMRVEKILKLFKSKIFQGLRCDFMRNFNPHCICFHHPIVIHLSIFHSTSVLKWKWNTEKKFLCNTAKKCFEIFFFSLIFFFLCFQPPLVVLCASVTIQPAVIDIHRLGFEGSSNISRDIPIAMLFYALIVVAYNQMTTNCKNEEKEIFHAQFNLMFSNSHIAREENDLVFHGTFEVLMAKGRKMVSRVVWESRDLVE